MKRCVRVFFVLARGGPVLLAIAVGLLVGFALRWHLPPTPRCVLLMSPLPTGICQQDFSRDGRFLAAQIYFESGPGRISSEILVWDLASGHELFRIPWRRDVAFGWIPRCSAAFSPDGGQLAVADGGSLDFWEVATGKHQGKIADIKAKFDQRGWGELTTDAEGRLLWQIWEGANLRFHDLFSGQKLGSAPASWEPLSLASFPGFVLVRRNKRWRLYGVPNGQRLGSLDLTDGFQHGSLYWALSADGSTLALLSGGIQVWDTRTGEVRLRDVPADHNLSLSNDGRLLATEVESPRRSDGWLCWLQDHLGISAAGHTSRVVVYDVDSQGEVVSFRGAHQAIFLPDGQTLAVSGPDGLILYDLPFRRPWARILGYAGAAALVTLMMLWGIPWLFRAFGRAWSRRTIVDGSSHNVHC
jgi:WD40 repeat protein